MDLGNSFTIMGRESPSLRSVEYGLQKRLVKAGYASELENISLSLDSLTSHNMMGLMKGDIKQQLSRISDKSLRTELAEDTFQQLTNQEFLSYQSAAMAKALFPLVSEESKQKFITYTNSKIKSAQDALYRIKIDPSQVPASGNLTSRGSLKDRFKAAELSDVYEKVHGIIVNVDNPKLNSLTKAFFMNQDFNRISDPQLKSDLAEDLLAQMSSRNYFSMGSINFVNQVLGPMVSPESKARYVNNIISQLNEISGLINNNQFHQRDSDTLKTLHQP